MGRVVNGYFGPWWERLGRSCPPVVTLRVMSYRRKVEPLRLLLSTWCTNSATLAVKVPAPYELAT